MAWMSTASAPRSRVCAPALSPSMTRNAARMPTRTIVTSLTSDSNEDLAAVHPVQHQPEDQQRRAPDDDRLVGRTEPLESSLAEMRVQRLRRVVLPDVDEDIHRDRVHPDDEEGNGPAPPSAHVDDPVEESEEQRRASRAEDRPRRRPDALHQRADAGETQRRAERDPRRAVAEERPQPRAVARRAADP